jgi:hypothetical protein
MYAHKKQSSPLGGQVHPWGQTSPLEANHVIKNWPKGIALVCFRTNPISATLHRYTYTQHMKPSSAGLASTYVGR